MNCQGGILVLAAFALGIGAASFASVVYGASKDRAESPTASPERPNQLTINNCREALITSKN